jgi:hypothetical protein
MRNIDEKYLFTSLINFTAIHRDVGDGSPLFLFGGVPKDKVFEFRDSPFNREHLKYSRLMSFFHDDIEYVVGDYVEVNDGFVCQISNLRYDRAESLHPTLTVVGKKLVAAAVFSRQHRNELPHDVAIDEVIFTPDKFVFSPQQILHKINVISDANHVMNEVVCRYEWHNGAIIPYKPLATLMCSEFIVNGIVIQRNQ